MEDTPPRDYAADLKATAENVDVVEERHNEVVDVYGELQSTRRARTSEIRAHLSVIQQSLDSLHEEIQTRIRRAKRATVLLSLLGQREELSPLSTRLQNQPYEHYVDKDWFIERMQKR